MINFFGLHKEVRGSYQHPFNIHYTRIQRIRSWLFGNIQCLILYQDTHTHLPFDRFGISLCARISHSNCKSWKIAIYCKDFENIHQ